MIPLLALWGLLFRLCIAPSGVAASRPESS